MKRGTGSVIKSPVHSTARDTYEMRDTTKANKERVSQIYNII